MHRSITGAVAVFLLMGCSPGGMATSPDRRSPPPTPFDGGGATPGDEGLTDSDGDGVPDVVEEAAGTDPTRPGSNPWLDGDFVFIVPFGMPPSPPRATFGFSTTIKQADVYFMIDTSWSMQREIDAVRGTLSGTIFPGLTAAIEDVQVGAGQFDVCPEIRMEPGSAHVGCTGIQNDASITSDLSVVEAGLAGMTPDCGVQEPYGQGVWLFATGDTSRWPTLAPRDCSDDPDGLPSVGYPCVRGGALPILVVIGDEPYGQGENCSRLPGTFVPTVDEVSAALNDIGGKIVVMGTTGRSAQWDTIGRATGSVDSAGDPYIFPDSARGTALGAQIVDAISQLAVQLPLDITARARDLDDDGVDAASFVERLETNGSGEMGDRRDTTLVCTSGLTTVDGDGDGFDDGFSGVLPGTSVCFDVLARQNDSVEVETTTVYRAAIEVLAEGVTVVDTRTAYFVVPAGGPAVF